MADAVVCRVGVAGASSRLPICRVPAHGYVPLPVRLASGLGDLRPGLPLSLSLFTDPRGRIRVESASPRKARDWDGYPEQAAVLSWRSRDGCYAELVMAGELYCGVHADRFPDLPGWFPGDFLQVRAGGAKEGVAGRVHLHSVQRGFSAPGRLVYRESLRPAGETGRKTFFCGAFHPVQPPRSGYLQRILWVRRPVPRRGVPPVWLWRPARSVWLPG